jgi:hypothetical protein
MFEQVLRLPALQVPALQLALWVLPMQAKVLVPVQLLAAELKQLRVPAVLLGSIQ